MGRVTVILIIVKTYFNTIRLQSMIGYLPGRVLRRESNIKKEQHENQLMLKISKPEGFRLIHCT